MGSNKLNKINDLEEAKKLAEKSLNDASKIKESAWKTREKRMKEFISEFNFSNYSTHIYNDINVEKGILHFAKDSNSDVIGMCTHGRKGLAHFFNGSISEDLVNHSKRPVVTFKI